MATFIGGWFLVSVVFAGLWVVFCYYRNKFDVTDIPVGYNWDYNERAYKLGLDKTEKDMKDANTNSKHSS